MSCEAKLQITFFVKLMLYQAYVMSFCFFLNCSRFGIWLAACKSTSRFYSYKTKKTRVLSTSCSLSITFRYLHAIANKGEYAISSSYQDAGSGELVVTLSTVLYDGK